MTDSKTNEIEQLLIDNPYDTKILSTLEQHVLHQVKTGEYDFDANRHLLKLYTVEPSGIKMDMVQKILVMALMQLPHNHFLACKYLLREDLHNDDHVKGIFKLESLLETAQFVKFWKEASDSKIRTVLDKISGFDDAIRSFMCSVIESAYQSISVSLLSELLRADAACIEAIWTKRGWTKDESDNGKTLNIPLGNENQFPRVTSTENISLRDICKVLSLRA